MPSNGRNGWYSHLDAEVVTAFALSYRGPRWHSGGRRATPEPGALAVAVHGRRSTEIFARPRKHALWRAPGRSSSLSRPPRFASYQRNRGRARGVAAVAHGRSWWSQLVSSA